MAVSSLVNWVFKWSTTRGSRSMMEPLWLVVASPGVCPHVRRPTESPHQAGAYTRARDAAPFGLTGHIGPGIRRLDTPHPAVEPLLPQWHGSRVCRSRRCTSRYTRFVIHQTTRGLIAWL